MIDLKNTAESLIADLINGLVVSQKSSVDIDALRDAVSEGAHQSAEDACIYHHHCEDIISRYEGDPRAEADGADDETGATYKPSEYRAAMGAYAYHIARSIIEAEAYALIDEIDEAVDTLADIMNNHNDERLLRGAIDTPEKVRITTDCPHGWAAHDYENNDGACFWVSRQLDGCNAVAIPAAGVWLSYTWE
jgi:hypothetical protein